MKIIGIVLVVIGLAGLLYGGVSWTRKDKVLDAGPIEITTDKHQGVSIPPLAGGVLIIAGAVLLIKG